MYERMIPKMIANISHKSFPDVILIDDNVHIIYDIY